MIDLHNACAVIWLMPVSSYGLKAVASWLGFRWGQKGVERARCLPSGWRQWRGEWQRRRSRQPSQPAEDPALQP